MLVPIETVNLIAGVLTIAAQVFAVFLVLALMYEERDAFRSFVRLIERHALRLSFAATLAAMLGSLYYSEIVGYEPCMLCWWQRIFMYPQVLIAGVALWTNDWRVFRYLMALSAVGAALAGYHYLLEWGLVPSGFCPANGPDCAQRFVYEFGYITIPLMSLTVFALSFLIAFVGRERHRVDSEVKSR
ncbi:MAG: hypothetical protein RL681_349 [Candidatus Parcubacteria bacterium]|jgi:disulfide bond formation protein DsbB